MAVRRGSKRNRKVSERMAVVDDDDRKNAQMVCCCALAAALLSTFWQRSPGLAARIHTPFDRVERLAQS